MTERLHSSTPHVATPTQSVFNAAARPFTKDALPPPEPLEEEPYTIKCICDYADDDGNTIYCETCDTWQHIECFYHGNVEEASRDDFNHFCADCKPRVLDRRKATERQRQQREDRPTHDSGGEKKTKRPPSKSHKKKPKPSDLQVNGYHDHDGGHGTKAGSPVESHGKKSKSHHKSHHSISSQVVKRSPPHHNRHHSHVHPPSPATTPPDLPDEFRIHHYSKQLENTLDNDPGSQNLRSNSFASLSVTDTMSLWLRDPEKLRTDAGVDDFHDVFQMVKADIDLPPPSANLHLRSKDVMGDDKMLQLLYLAIDEPLGKSNLLVGELKGFVDFQKNYYNEDPVAYARLCHPAPFVFFHPRLPIYIDTRREGSQCRYIRRSCRSNTTLDTYITKLTEYHFCVVNDRPLDAGEQITLPWTFQFKAEINARYLQLLGLADEDTPAEQDVSDVEYHELKELIHNVLSDYGGCACGLGPDCAFARFHRNYLRKSQALSNGLRTKKGRKPKQHVSPTSTGHATSRDASEGQQEPYDGEDDSRSTSGSVQGKPQSRDMTPLGLVAGESHRIATEHVSEREKRKLMDIEKTFEKMDQAQPPRKKKRTSDGPITSSGMSSGAQKPKKASRPPLSNSSTQVNGSARTYKDAGTSRQQSDSPSNAHSPMAVTPVMSRAPSRPPSLPLRASYQNASTQTDETEDAWYSKPQTSTPRKSFIPLNKRLLRSQLTLRMKRESRLTGKTQAPFSGIGIGPMSHTVSPELPDYSRISCPGQTHFVLETHERPKSSGSSIMSAEGSVAMTDAPMPDAPLSAVNSVEKPHWPAIPSNLSSPLENRPADLRVQLPLNPLHLTNGSQITPILPSPSANPPSAGAPMAQSPYSAVQFPAAFPPSVLNSLGQQPSPVKKKLSLNEYKARLASNKASSNDPDSAPLTLKPSSLVEESKVPRVLEGSAVVDSPVAEKREDPMAIAGGNV